MVGRRNKAPYAAAFLAGLALLAVIAGIQWHSGAMVIEVYGVDSLFVLDVMLRTELGFVPHRDFTLHVGALPFLSVAAASDTLLVGFLRAQWCLAAVLIAASGWIGFTRLTPLGTAILILITTLLATGLSTGFDPRVTLALFYNRWAWAIGLVFATAAFVPKRKGASPYIDGALLGALAMALLLTKVTFFVGLVPLAFAVYLFRKDWTAIAAGVTAFGLASLLIAATFGAAFWSAYLDNLVWVATNPIRPTPGNDPLEIFATPEAIALGLFLFLVIRFRSLKEVAGLSLLSIAFLFIQMQNFGNVPLWAAFFALLSISFFSDDATDTALARAAWATCAVFFLTFTALYLLPTAQGSLRNMDNVQSAEIEPLMPDVPGMAGLFVPGFHVTPVVKIPNNRSPDTPQHIGSCYVTEGYVGQFREVADALAELDGQVFVADAPSPYWIHSGQSPLSDAAPWNYGSLRGLQHADYIAVPDCSFKPSYQRQILRELKRQGFILEPFKKTDVVTIFRYRNVSDD